MHSAYYETRFTSEEPIEDWPSEFAIITAYPIMGQQWNAEQVKAAEEKLRGFLEGGSLVPKVWHRRLIGYSPVNGHAEPGWAAELDFSTACQIGEDLHQDAI